jgi:hypothetical protein
MKRFVLLGLMGVMNATVCMDTTAADGANLDGNKVRKK